MINIIFPLLILSVNPPNTPLYPAVTMITLSLYTLSLAPSYYGQNTYILFYNDKLSIVLITLTLWVSALIIITFNNINHSPTTTILILTIFLVLAFSTSNILVFYIFFEASLIPTIVLILTWGNQPERINAAIYFFLYTLILSLSFLVIIFLWSNTWHTLYIQNPLNIAHDYTIIWSNNENWILLILTPFLVNVPIYSLHLWLPNAHVEAPLAGSIILASILLNLGGYGLCRLNNIIINIYQSDTLNYSITTLAVIGTIYTSLACINQTDLNALIAYSSVAHIGPIIVAVISITHLGLLSATTIIIAHGLTSSCLFVLANVNYSSTNSRSLTINNGTIVVAPALTILWFITLATNISTPPSLNFMGEIISVPPIININPYYILPIVSGVFMTGAYSLLLYTSINHGPVISSIHIQTPPPQNDILLITYHLIPLITIPLTLTLIIYSS